MTARKDWADMVGMQNFNTVVKVKKVSTAKRKIGRQQKPTLKPTEKPAVRVKRRKEKGKAHDYASTKVLAEQFDSTVVENNYLDSVPNNGSIVVYLPGTKERIDYTFMEFDNTNNGAKSAYNYADILDVEFATMARKAKLERGSSRKMGRYQSAVVILPGIGRVRPNPPCDMPITNEVRNGKRSVSSTDSKYDNDNTEYRSLPFDKVSRDTLSARIEHDKSVKTGRKDTGTNFDFYQFFGARMFVIDTDIIGAEYGFSYGDNVSASVQSASVPLLADIGTIKQFAEPIQDVKTTLSIHKQNESRFLALGLWLLEFYGKTRTIKAINDKYHDCKPRSVGGSPSRHLRNGVYTD